MRAVERADQFQRRHRALGYPLGVVYKFIDDQGAYLAALITYYGFLSIFPLMLLLSSVLGFLTQHNPGLRQAVIDSVLHQIPVIGAELATPKGLQGSLPAVVTGSVIALYGGLGVAQALQHTSNTCWSVPRNARPNPILMRVRSAAVLLFLGVTLISVGWLPRLWTPLNGTPGIVLNIVLGTGLFLLLMKMTTARGQGWRRLAPGAFLVSLVWQLFVYFAPQFTSAFLSRSSVTYGAFSTVLALLIATYILATAFVVGTEMNVVLDRHLYPRALMTQFTDDVDLTLADQQAYAAQSQMQRFKNYQYVDVVFDKDGDGVADQPSDLGYRWHDAVQAHEQWLERGHPSRPVGMWGMTGEDDDPRSIDGSE